MNTVDKINVIEIVPKDLYFVLELSVTQLAFMKMLFDHAQIDFNGEKEPEMVPATKFLHETLYPFLKKIQDKEFGDL